jgi:MFS family permease
VRRIQLGIPQSIVPIFWGLALLEATYGAYLGILPLWIERLGAPVAIVGVILGASGFLRLFILAPSASIADAVGYRRAIVVCRVFAVVGLITASLANHWTHLLLFVIGIAIGEMVFPLLQSLVAAQAGDQRMRSFALVFTVGPSVALALAPLLTGALVAAAGMRAAFVLAAFFSVLSIFFLTRIEEPAGIRQRDMAEHSSYRDTIADPRIRIIVGLLLVVVFALSLGVSFVPTYLQDQRGLQPALIASLAAFAAVGSAIFGVIVARQRRLQRAPFIGVAIAVGSTAIALILYQSSTMLAVLVLAFIFRGGLFSAWAMLNAALGENAPPHRRSRGFALVEMAGGVAFALGPIVAGVLYGIRPTLPFQVSIALAITLIPLLVLTQHQARSWSTAAIQTPVRLTSLELEPEIQLIGDDR